MIDCLYRVDTMQEIRPLDYEPDYKNAKARPTKLYQGLAAASRAGKKHTNSKKYGCTASDISTLILSRLSTHKHTTFTSLLIFPVMKETGTCLRVAGGGKV